MKKDVYSNLHFASVGTYTPKTVVNELTKTLIVYLTEEDNVIKEFMFGVRF